MVKKPEGVRIHHPNPAVWGSTLLIPHPGDPGTGRKPKDYHIRLDSEGNCIVSSTVWDRLVQARDLGLTPHQFIIMNTVTDPPKQVMGQSGPVEQRRMFRQEQEALREIAPQGVKATVQRVPLPNSPQRKNYKRDPRTGR